MSDAPYKMDGGIARLRVVDSRGLKHAVQRGKDAIRHAKECGVERLLVDISAIDIGPPTITERHWAMVEWASVGRGAVRIAVVIRPEFFDPDHFGTIVAASRGLTLRGFADEEDAVAWLTDDHDAHDLPPASGRS